MLMRYREIASRKVASCFLNGVCLTLNRAERATRELFYSITVNKSEGDREEAFSTAQTFLSKHNLMTSDSNIIFHPSRESLGWKRNGVVSLWDIHFLPDWTLTANYGFAPLLSQAHLHAPTDVSDLRGSGARFQLWCAYVHVLQSILSSKRSLSTGKSSIDLSVDHRTCRRLSGHAALQIQWLLFNNQA